MSAASEDRWLRDAGRGDRPAFEALVAATAPAVWSLMQRLTASETVAEEALQETYIALWRGADRYRGDGSARAFIFGIARKHAARTWRRRAGEPTATESLSDLAEQAGWGEDPEALAMHAEDRRLLLAAAATLSQTDQDVLTRCDLQGEEPAEVARDLGVPVGTLRVRLHRARLRLMAALKREVCDE